MTAAVKIYEMTASIVGWDKTSGRIRFENSTGTIVDRDNRMQVPAAGTNYSFTKQIRTYVATAPSVDLQNIYAYTDGTNSFGTGIDVQYDTAASIFLTATRTNISASQLFTATVGFPIKLSQGLASTEFLGTGFKAKLLRMQMSVANTAAPGSLVGETLTLSYDET